MRQANFGSAIPTNALGRRDALRIGGLGFLGLTLPKLAAAEQISRRAGTAKSVIFLYQFGGPSHLETFDMKPNAPDGIRGKFSPIATSAPGVSICERLPETAKVMDRVTLIRSVFHNMKNHNSASYYALTGHAPPVDDIRLRDTLELFPAYGSVIDRLTPERPGLPGFAALPHIIRDGSVTPGQHASFLGKRHDPLRVLRDPNDPEFSLPELTLPESISYDRLQDRRSIQKLINSQVGALDRSVAARGLDSYYERTLAMLNSPSIREAFDVSRESTEVRERYGRTTYGQSCLLARRLVEAGVKFVNVYFDSSIGGQSKTRGGWDTHGFNNTRMYPILEAWQLPQTERTLPTLILDLEERGLLDETLIVWMGEFGRTPKINDNISRDHWPQCYTVLMAGGGTRGGYVHGASDRSGAYPDVDPVRLEDVAATVFEAMGVDAETEVRDVLNRPLAISSGKPVYDVFV